MISALVFSKDRPLQLDACLSSLYAHARGELDVTILYTTSSERHAQAYERLRRSSAIPGRARFKQQGVFERDVRKQLKGTRHVLLAVDDSIFVEDFDAGECAAFLDRRPQAAGVSLRLSPGSLYCYPIDRPQTAPVFRVIDVGFFAWDWQGADGDFGYPFEVSSSLYRTDDLLTLLDRVRFQNPNELEFQLAMRASWLAEFRPELVCYEHPKAFAWPANRVQNQIPNRCGSDPKHSSEALLEAFEQGLRINVAALSGYRPPSCHDELAPVRLT